MVQDGKNGTKKATNIIMLVVNITGALTMMLQLLTTGGNSGDVLLTFSTDRSWQVSTIKR